MQTTANIQSDGKTRCEDRRRLELVVAEKVEYLPGVLLDSENRSSLRSDV